MHCCNKATTMVNRINGAYGLSWSARPQRFCEATITHPYRGNTVGPVDVVIGCVDTGASRRAIDAFVRTHSSSVYWIDSGNSEASGQIVIGQGEGSGRSDNVSPLRLPLVSELYPEILQARNDDTAPSCSARDALSSQALATNAMCAAWIVT